MDSLPTPPTRGIIVVDSADLVTMTQRYPNAVRGSPLAELSSRTETYLDILPLLAQHGFRVIVPEMVALETCGILHNGVDTRTPFKESDREDRSEQRRILKQLLLGQSQFMRIAPSPPGDGTGGYRDYISNFTQSFRVGEVGNTRTHKSKRGSARVAQRESIQRLHRERPGDFGEQQAMDIVTAEVVRQRKERTSIPIFFFSSDSGARKDLRGRIKSSHCEGDAPVNVLSVDGLLCGLANATSREGTNGLQELGLTPEVNAHWKEMLKHRPWINAPQTPGESANEYHDSPVEAFSTGRFPFQQAVSGVAQESADERRAKQTEVAETKVDRVAEYNRRYGRTANPSGTDGTSRPGGSR